MVDVGLSFFWLSDRLVYNYYIKFKRKNISVHSKCHSEQSNNNVIQKIVWIQMVKVGKSSLRSLDWIEVFNYYRY